MLRRCLDFKNKKYKKYGGATPPVTVHPAWVSPKYGGDEHGYERFLEYMGPRPPGTSLDRWPNPAGNYEPGNCRWATLKEQRANRREPGRSYGKLTVAQVNEIRAAWDRGEATQIALAARFGVDNTTIHCVVHRKTHRARRVG